MKKELTVPREILVFALRYSLGRQTYAPSMVREAIENNIDILSENDIKLYIREIEECEYYGDESEKNSWLKFKEELAKVLDKKSKEK